jgi:hypothetical protein
MTIHPVCERICQKMKKTSKASRNSYLFSNKKTYYSYKSVNLLDDIQASKKFA